MSPAVRVVKVGGSLFSFDRLVPCLREWLEQQPAATNVLVAGCGPLADFIRDASKRFELSDVSAHWMCVDLMSVTARLLGTLLPESVLLTDYASLETATSRAQLVVFDPVQFMRDVEPHLAGNRVPQNWTVTSDSIAARVAEAIGAEELVLMKSADVAGATLLEAGKSGLVDEFFSTAVQPIGKMRLVNLRSARFRETHLV